VIGTETVPEARMSSVACTNTECVAVGLGLPSPSDNSGIVVYGPNDDEDVPGTLYGQFNSVACNGNFCTAVGIAETAGGQAESVWTRFTMGDFPISALPTSGGGSGPVFCPSAAIGCSDASGNSIVNLQSSAASTVPVSISAVGCFTTCEAVGSDASGEGAVMPLTPPTTTVALPSNAATLAGGLYLDAAASDNVRVTRSTTCSAAAPTTTP